MNAETVHKVAKALSKEEQKKLFKILKKDFEMHTFIKVNNPKKTILTKKKATEYLIENIFSKVRK